MKIYKIAAGVQSFMEGLKAKDISMMPPADQLTEEQKREIKRATLDINDPVTRLGFFNKYPQDTYFSLYDLVRCIQWHVDSNAIMTAWTNFKKYVGVTTYGFPEDMPVWMVQDIMNSNIKITAGPASDVFFRSEKFPPEFVTFLAKKFPTLAKGARAKDDKSIRTLIKNYLEFPSAEGAMAIEIALFKKEMTPKEGSDRMQYRPLQDRKVSQDMVNFQFNSKLGDYVDKLSHRNRGMYDDDTWSGTTKDVVAEINRVLEFVNKNQELPSEEYLPFAYKMESTQFGNVGILSLGNYIIKKSVLDVILKTITQHPATEYWNLYWGGNPGDQLRRHDIKVKKEDMEQSLYLISEDEHVYFNLGKDRKNWASPKVDYSDNYIGKLFVPRNLHVTEKEYSDMFNQWVQAQAKSNKFNMKHTYLDMINSPAVKQITEKAGHDLFLIKIQGSTVKDAESFDPSNIENTYGTVWPFTMQSATDFWSQVPLQIKNSVSETVCSRYMSLSGQFPCDKVYARMSKNLYDLKNTVNAVSCMGDEKQTREALKRLIEEKEQQSVNDLRERFPEFLKSGLVKIYKLTDFPELYEHVKKLLSTHADRSRGTVYSPKQKEHIPPVDRALEEIADVNIYLIKGSDYIGFWGKEGTMFAPVSPDSAGGFFAPRYSIWGTDPTIIVFTDNSSDFSPELILKELGIEATNGTINFTDESTLWHEVGHAFLDNILPGSNIEEPKDNSVDVWMTKPSEIAAINYGNIPFIKKKLREYFAKIFPFNERITAGLVQQMKSDIVKIFAMEFHNLPPAQAYQEIRSSMPEFEQNTLDSINAMSTEEQITYMTNMFAEFFIRKSMRSKVENEMEARMKEIGQNAKNIKFEEEPTVPDTEPYVLRMPGTRDQFIAKMETRPDYQQFIKACQDRITQAHQTMNPQQFLAKYGRYIHRNQMDTIRPPFEIEDLLAFLFQTPSTIPGVKLDYHNDLFYDLAPQSLVQDVVKLVENERTLQVGQGQYKPKKTPVTPDEAEDTGAFMSEMEEAYGPDWIWLAKSKNWYKKACIAYRKT